MKQPTPMNPPAAASQGSAAPEPEASGDMTQASPEEQALYDMFVNQALDIIYPEDAPGKPRDQIVENLRGVFDPQVGQMFQAAEPPVSESPDDAVAVTGVVLTMMTEAALSQRGTDIPDEIVFHAGKEVIELLVELSEGLGIGDFGPGDVDDMFLRAMDLYRLASPRVDPEALTAEFEQIVAADRSGGVGKLLPGAEEYAKQRQSQPEGAQPEGQA